MKILLGTLMRTVGTEEWGKINNTAKRILLETKNLRRYIDRHFD
jgi:hypothetical protein